MLFQVQIQPKSLKSISVYGNCEETTQAHYMTKLYHWLMHDIIIIIIDYLTKLFPQRNINVVGMILKVVNKCNVHKGLMLPLINYVQN